ncbi:acetylcholine receptor subunit beta-like 1 isoform X3 [Lingula anatina]|uniref:Acetylcholine receptor subunit beta-like 1 isoform X3 n=1 Tax=Lingula anatina TaxID=7574 RepID=A0A1S3J8U2_LINAN|nr:acetylcholine receptor subunit beta-like 1 isoform X3 [Lingula anatina]|eukprot:XP_013406815.1 acetylcholine receptor subunit beta-like 1 isoform X3 [Lingula anatina]
MTRSCIGLYFVYVILTSIRIQCFVSRTGLGSEDESKLVEDLFDKTGYNPLIRPVQNLSDKLMINFGLTMIQLINVDEKNQIMKTNVWLQTVWYDYQLVWDPADYGGISSIRVPMDKVWTPDIVLFNNADGKYQTDYRSNVVVYEDGTMLHVPPAIFKSSCEIDVKYFPFDEQECEMHFASWTYTGEQVGFDWYYQEKPFKNYSTVDLADYMPSGTWDIVVGPGAIVYRAAKDDKPAETRVIYYIRIRRKTLFYIVNLIIPCILISFLSVSTFYLPSEACEKVALSISILIALVVFILLISKLLPPTSLSVPLIVKFLMFTFIMNIVSVLLAVMTINWHFRSPNSHSMPKWVRVVFLNYLPRLLLVKRPNHENQYRRGCPAEKQLTSEERWMATLKESSLSTEVTGTSLKAPKSTKAEQIYKTASNQNPKDGRESSKRNVPKRLMDAANDVAFIARHLKESDDTQNEVQDWKYFALVVDRLLLYLFFIVTIGGTCGLFFNVPHIFHRQEALTS